MNRTKIYILLFSITYLVIAISSCKKNDDRIPEEQSQEEAAIVYQECDFNGYAIAITLGDFNLEGLTKKGIRNNDISSIKVNRGYIIELYDGDNMIGDVLTKIGHINCLSSEGWDNKVTSFRVIKNPNNNPLSAPTGLNAIALSDTRASLTWADNSDDEMLFHIEVYSDDMKKVTSLTTEAGATKINIDGLTIDTKYSFLVFAESLGGVSLPSNRATVQTLRQEPENIDDLMSLATGFTKSSKTPMGKHFEGLKVATADDIAYLNNPANQPPKPVDASNLEYKHFTVTLYPYGNPSPADINQHAIGNCNGITAMASMAYLAPAFVKNLITDNGDNTYTIKMFDPKGQRITLTIDNQFLANSSGNLDAVSGKNGVATWSTILEKAIMKYNVVYQANPDIGGIGSEHTTPLFTGEGSSFAFDRGKLTASQLARVVRYGLANGKFISGGFSPQKTIGNLNTVTAHGYALVISNNSSSIFGMRNPWGVNPISGGGYDTTADGVLNIPAIGDVPPTIDLRIIDPGLAGSAGRTDAYIPPKDALKSGAKIRISTNLLGN